MKTREILKPVILVLFLLTAFSEVAIADQSNSLYKELKKVDAFHPPTDSGLMPLYNEWHYFNVIDDKQNLSIICTFKLNGCIDSSEILLGYYTNDEHSGAYYQAYPISTAKYSSQKPDVTIANSTVRLTPKGYLVHVVSDDGSKVLDALFKPEAEPSPVFNATGFSPVHEEVINWIVTSSKMKVNGKLTVDGKTYTLKNERGYHDHNWGYWNWGNIGWDWGQTTQTKNRLNGNDIGKYSLGFGNITDTTSTRSVGAILHVWRNREMVATFTDENVQVKHSNFVDTPIPLNQETSLPAGSFPLPLKTDISVSSDSKNYLNIKFAADPIDCYPLPISVPGIDENGNILIKCRIIWEMIGTYQVDGKIHGKPISFTTDGFIEYVSEEAISPEISPENQS